jgi:hypothetical protein
MTQDHGPGYVVRGEVVTDDDTGEFPAEQADPMTHFQRVASALGDDRPEPSAPDADAVGNVAADAPFDEEDRPDSDEVGAVRSPDAAGRDDWDDEDDTEPTSAGATAPAAPSGTAEEPAEDRDQADTATGPHEATVPVATVPVAPVPVATVPVAPVPVAPEAVAPEAVAAEVTGKHAGAPAEPELRPGEADAGLGDFSDLTYGSLLPDASEFRERWEQVQFRFVDDPHGSVTEAADVIAQVTARLEAAIAERQRAIAERQQSLRGRWGDGTNADTETLRATLLMYRAFLDQLAGPRIS